ncbi:PREDICTED: vesicle transport through interaction with t-SNAREs homolog 1B-like [Priapulus caudatus]|uniref:Vesicle transport through interaction with t-SNAREs homolog 1B-like n=1 Tax=Priapulus caudatus TaxID=37621 RepID=A0ABM1EQF2_PRICU|nr:PREDICTED: vesicle transport through interaction with t-SNAREs homolog 1B-like [Priapulus caudatus]
MTSEKFETLEEDFRTLCQDVRTKLARVERSSATEENRGLLREVERDIEDGQATVREMEDECRNAPPTYRAQMNRNVTSIRKELDQIAQNVRRLSTSGDAAQKRTSLLSGRPGADTDSFEAALRGQAAFGTETLSRTSSSIHRSQAVAVETEEIGDNIITDLGSQRESLHRTRDRLVETDQNLSRSRRILRTMYRRVMTNKLILIIVILLEVALLVGIVYWKFFI